MRYTPLIIFSILLAFILLAGCIDPPVEPTAKKVDIGISTITLANAPTPALGSKFPVKISTVSDDQTAEYTLHIKMNGEDILSQPLSGSQTKQYDVPATNDGDVNITAAVFLKDSKNYTDTNISNDFLSLSAHILPYGNYVGVIKETNKTSYYECNTSNTSYCRKDELLLDVENYTSIYERRTYGTKLHFDADTAIFSIGIFPRQSLLLSPNATLYYYIYPIVNGTPTRESMMNFSTSFLNIPPDWGGISLLRRKTPTGKLPAGDYVLEIYVDQMSSADIACNYISENGTTFERTEPSPIRQWYPGPNCSANIIISSRNELDTYKEYMAANGMIEAKPKT
jgi:hypothetical protein